MKSLRPLQADDLEQVAALFLRVVRPGARESVVETAEYFQRTTLEHPWADPEIPSLVFVDDRGAITGFVGSYVARMRLEGSPIRAACPGNLVAAPEAGGFAPGALLLREHLSGPQEVTFVDTLGGPARAMWKALGGEIASLGALHWLRVFRPFRLANARFVEPRARGGASKMLVSSLCGALDAVARTVTPGRLRAVVPSTSAQPLEAGQMMDEFRRLSASLRLYPDYDQAYLDWLFGELARPRRRGTLVRHLVLDGERVLGWYVYYLKPGGISRVLQVMGSEKDIGSVLDHLFHDADAAGAAALDGRVEPRLLEPLAQRGCLLRYAGAAGVHSHDREVLDAVASRRSVFTRMDSEYWPVPPRRP